MSTERYSFSLTTFSPSGKLVQIEYALNAVSNGAQSIGIRCPQGVVLATEKKLNPCGLGPDARVLCGKARKEAQQYQLLYNERIPTLQLVQKVARIMQEYTQMGGVRPFGVSLLVAGYDDYENEPSLHQCDPSGAYFGWKATALGKNFVNAKSFLDRRYTEELELEDAVHTAILTLKEGFEGQMNEFNIEIGVCNKDGFKRLSPDEIKDYLANIGS